MKIRPITVSLLVAFAPVAVGPTLGRTAFAQPSADDAATAAARARFKEGVQYFDRGQYENARASFLQAYALRAHPDVLFNLASSCLRSAHHAEASKYFTQYLAEAKNIPAAKRAEAEKQLDQAHSKLGRIDVTAPAGAEVSVDSERVGTAPVDPIYVEPGTHSVHFKSGDGREESQSVSLLAGQQKPAVLRANVAPGAAAGGAPGSSGAAPSEGGEAGAEGASNGLKKEGREGAGGDAGHDKSPGIFTPPDNMTPIYVGGGIAVAGFGLAIVMAAVKSSAQAKADDVAAQIVAHGGRTGICVSTNAADVNKFGNACAQLSTDNKAVNTDAAIGNVALGVGIAAVAATAIYYAVGSKTEKPATAKGPKLVPLVGTSLGGLSISGSF